MEGFEPSSINGKKQIDLGAYHYILDDTTELYRNPYQALMSLLLVSSPGFEPRPYLNRNR